MDGVWNWYYGGLAVGLYALIQLLVSCKVLGVSMGYVNICRLFSNLKYFQISHFETPKYWRLWFLLGLPLGGAIGVYGSWSSSFSLGAFYDAVLPNSVWLKAPILVLGGIFMGYGARVAGGCTSGHVISGLSIMNPPSILAAIGFFAGGILIVRLLSTFI